MLPNSAFGSVRPSCWRKRIRSIAKDMVLALGLIGFVVVFFPFFAAVAAVDYLMGGKLLRPLSSTPSSPPHSASLTFSRR